MHATPPSNADAVRGLLAALAVVVFWSGFNIVSRFGATASFTPFDIAALRFGVSGAIALPLYLRFVPRRGLLGGVRLGTAQDAEHPNPTFIREGFEAAEWLARHTGGLAQSMVTEALADIPTTAHLLGGAVIGRDASCGVVDARGRAFGYQQLLVCDGSILPANPGVNPSLTITALAEHLISQVPARADVTA